MGRKLPGEGHPGLTKDLVKMAEASEALRTIPGWEVFSPVEKEFLCLLPWYGSKNDTARAIGRSEGWLKHREKINAAFREATKHPTVLATNIHEPMGQDLVGKSMLRLNEMLEPTFNDKRTQFQVIKYLHTLMGYVDGGKDRMNPIGGRQTYINAQNITMFDGIPSKATKQPIEAEAQIVEDDEEATTDIHDLIPATTPTG